MPGSATVVFTFTGVLNDKLCGFYRSKYTVNGEDRWAGLLVLEFVKVSVGIKSSCWIGICIEKLLMYLFFYMEIIFFYGAYN
jgi:hypothetical protein